MMKVRVPVLVKDPAVAEFKGVALQEDFLIESEDVFLDGPVTRRVAILDFDPESGALVKGARFSPPRQPDGEGRYVLPQESGASLDVKAPAFMQVSCFGGVYKTISMFEEPDTLGRRVDWAFDGPQLLVVPRAGEWANAFYERDSRSIQLFFVTLANGQRVYTCHSQDIIAHETAHAVIDGVAPDLYHATTPEGLAIHESLADLATLINALRNRRLTGSVLGKTGGDLDQPTVLTAIAEQFAHALHDHQHGLRNLSNSRTMKSLGADRSEPHALSEVLSGALYAMLVRIYEELRDVDAPEQVAASRYAEQAEVEQYRAASAPAARSSPGRALFIATERFKRTVLRALDYLPPGEVGFADFGRALLAADKASHPDSDGQREFLIDEFVRRGIVTHAAELAVETNMVNNAVSRLDLDELVRSDWLAYKFANAQRRLLGIPPELPFEVRPRLDVTKKYYHKGQGAVFQRECLLKVCWSETEPADVGSGLPRKRRFVRGSTLAIDWDTHKVRAVVSGRDGEAARSQRDAFVRRLNAAGQLRVGPAALRPDGKPVRGAVRGDVVDDTLRLRATAQALHILSEQ